MDTDTAWQLSAAEAVAAQRRGEIDSAALTESHLARLAATNPALNAVVNPTAELARAQAAAADAAAAQGAWLGPLHGVPVTVKINVDLAGQPNTNGVVALAGQIAAEDAPVIANLKRAGAVIIGQTNTPEFSMRWCTDNPLHGLTRNPWDPAITCGGSSGGAGAATAAGIGTIAHGNDIGGSLRWPAHCNALATIKPGLGRVPAFNPSLASERPFLAQQFSTQGPLARRVDDVILALSAMATHDPRDPNHAHSRLHFDDDATPCRVLLADIPDDMEGDPVVLAQLQRAADWLAEAGYAIERGPAPALDEVFAVWFHTVLAEMRLLAPAAMFEQASDDFRQVWEAYCALGELPDTVGLLRAMSERQTLIRHWQLQLQRTALILAPVSTARTPGPRGDLALGGGYVLKHQLRFTTALNALGLPVASVATGTVAGEGGSAQPVGVQLIGARAREMRCLHAARVIERRAAIDWPAMWARMGG